MILRSGSCPHQACFFLVALTKKKKKKQSKDQVVYQYDQTKLWWHCSNTTYILSSFARNECLHRSRTGGGKSNVKPTWKAASKIQCKPSVTGHLFLAQSSCWLLLWYCQSSPRPSCYGTPQGWETTTGHSAGLEADAVSLDAYNEHQTTWTQCGALHHGWSVFVCGFVELKT